MIYIIAGQTASGKTALALDFASRIGGQIINGDAFQVYRHLDIGTAKPNDEERALVPHHLYDIVDINESFSIYDYQKKAREKIDELTSKNIPAIIVGGSGLYIRSVLFDYTFSDDKAVDMTEYETMEINRLHDELKRIDPESAAIIHANNKRRVLRAIEIYLQTGRAKSQIEREQIKTPLYQYTMVAIEIDRDQLGTRIEERVRNMFALGLRAETEKLLKIYAPTDPGFRAIGYKEFVDNPHLDDESLITLIALNTRQYAKRQKTFFKNQFTMNTYSNHNDALNDLLRIHEEYKNE